MLVNDGGGGHFPCNHAFQSRFAGVIGKCVPCHGDEWLMVYWPDTQREREHQGPLKVGMSVNKRPREGGILRHATQTHHRLLKGVEINWLNEMSSSEQRPTAKHTYGYVERWWQAGIIALKLKVKGLSIIFKGCKEHIADTQPHQTCIHWPGGENQAGSSNLCMVALRRSRSSPSAPCAPDMTGRKLCICYLWSVNEGLVCVPRQTKAVMICRRSSFH